MNQMVSTPIPEEILAKIKSLVAPEDYKEQEVEPYIASWRGEWHGKTPLVLFPRTTQQVAAIVSACKEANIAIVPQGGNTGLVGGGVPDASNQQIVLSLSRMRSVREIDPLGFTMIVEAGCILQHLQEVASDHNMLFPLSMASEGSCQLGGVIATNAGGTAVVRYGNTRSLVLGLEVVLPDGQIWHGLRSLRKDNTGYDLKQLFIGSEGTLGIITAASLQLFPKPQQIVTVFTSVSSIENVLALYKRCRTHLGEFVTAFELITRQGMQLLKEQFSSLSHPLALGTPYYLLLEFTTTQPGALLRSAVEEVLASSIENSEIQDAVFAENYTHRKDFWQLREHLPEAIKRAGRGIHCDICVPISRLPQFFEHMNPKVQALSALIILVPFGHVGDGNIHYNMYLTEEISLEALTELAEEVKFLVSQYVVEMGGSFSAEHGIGQERQDLLYRLKQPIELKLMHEIKAAIDPDCVFNPGKLLTRILPEM